MIAVVSKKSLGLVLGVVRFPVLDKRLAKIHEWKLPGTYHGVAPTKDGRYLAALNKNSLVYILRLGAFPDYLGK